jgi:competence protein ComEC
LSRIFLTVILFLSLTLFAWRAGELREARELDSGSSPHQFVVWNIGQGLWTTFSTAEACHHFDSGGEHAPWRAIKNQCENKLNILLYSHWDLDHISFAKALTRNLAHRAPEKICLKTPPAGTANLKKQNLLSRFSLCPSDKSDHLFVREISRASTFPDEPAPKKETSNDISHVFIAGLSATSPQILVPGDSTQKAEKRWAPGLSRLPIWLLVLGHHGSRTSTSDLLIRNLPKIHMAVASSRFAKYGHPHQEVRRKLKSAGIALLTTEDWGTLRFEIPPSLSADRTVGAKTNTRSITDGKVCTQDSNCERRARKSHAHRKHSNL